MVSTLPVSSLIVEPVPGAREAVERLRAAGVKLAVVPNARTRPEEVAAAPDRAPDLASAVDMLVGGGS